MYTFQHNKVHATSLTYLTDRLAGGCLVGALGLGYGALPESVLESTRHGFKISHAASSSCSLPLSLRSPSNVTTDLLSGVSTRRAYSLLLVERDLSAPTASRVSLCLPLTKRLCTFSLLTKWTKETELEKISQYFIYEMLSMKVSINRKSGYHEGKNKYQS